MGLATTLQRPGGNVTGLASVPSELSGKRLEVIKAASGALRVAILVSPMNTSYRTVVKGFETAARTLGVTVGFAQFRLATDFNAGFQAATRERVGAIVVMDDSVTFNTLDRIVVLAMQSHLSTMCGLREFVTAGGLMAFGPNLSSNWRRAATYVNELLKGAKLGDLTIETRAWLQKRRPMPHRGTGIFCRTCPGPRGQR